MQKFHQLENSSLKAFYYAAQELHFTNAAEKAGLTQSGISQHIDKLEKELGVDLFNREKRQLSLTTAGHKLLNFVVNQLDAVEGLIEDIQAENEVIKGLVRYAMPDSCLFSPHLQEFIAIRNKKFPHVNLQVQICSSEEVIDKLLQHEIDFGFITQTLSHPQIEFKKFVNEEYVLVSSEKNLDFSKDKLEKLRFIDYPEAHVLYERWCSTQLRTNKLPRWQDLPKAGAISSISGAIKMVESGLGVSFFQRHCVEGSLKQKKLYEVGTTQISTKNPIYIVTLKNKRLSERVKISLQAFEMLKA